LVYLTILDHASLRVRGEGIMGRKTRGQICG